MLVNVPYETLDLVEPGALDETIIVDTDGNPKRSLVSDLIPVEAVVGTKQIFNAADVTTNTRLAGTTGVLTPTASANDIISNYIPIGAAQAFYISGHTSGVTKNVSYYDSSQVFISGVALSASATEIGATTPANTAYMRMTIAVNGSTNNLNNIMVNLGTSAFPHDTYQRVFGVDEIKDMKIIASRIQPHDTTKTYAFEEMVESTFGRIFKSKKNGNTAALTDTTFWEQKIADTDAFNTMKAFTYSAGPNVAINYNPSTKILLVRKVPTASNVYLYVSNGSSNAAGAPNSLRIGLSSSTGFTIDFTAQSILEGKPVVYGVIASDAFFNGTLSGYETIANTSIVAYPLDGVSTNFRLRNFVPLFVYDGLKNVVKSPFFQDKMSAEFQLSETDRFWLTYAKTPIFNKYPNFRDYVSMKAWQRFKNSYIDGEACRLVMFGDSIFARWEHTTNVNNLIDPTRSAPGATTANTFANLIEFFKPSGRPNPSHYNLAEYARWDATATFTEGGGSWATVTNNAAWDDVSSGLPTRDTTVRMSNSATASIAFAFPAAYERLNFIDKAHTIGTPTVNIAVAEGNGFLEYRTSDAGSWVEANGATFSQLHGAANTSQRRGNTIYAREGIQLRKTALGLGNAYNVTLTNGSGDGTKYLTYWGVELIKKNKTFLKVVNGARGGKNALQLSQILTNEVLERNPRLVIFEIPLINDLSGTPTALQTMLDQIESIVWGTGSLATTYNMKTASGGNWENMSLLCVLPHQPIAHFITASGLPDTASNGIPYETYYRAVINLFATKGDVPLLDIRETIVAMAKANPDWRDNQIRPIAGSSPAQTGNTLVTDDNTHPNNNGCRVYADTIGPIIW